MGLQEIEYNEQASSQKLNDNFNYLDDCISEANLRIDGLDNDCTNRINNAKSQLQKNIDTLNSTVNSVKKTADDAVSKAKSAAGGGWVWKAREVRDGETTVGSRSYNVKDYLGSNDGNSYELYIHAYMRDDSSTRKYCRISSTSFGNNTNTGQTFCQLVTGGYADMSVNDFILPVKSSDKIFYTLTGGTVDFLQIRILGYKKLGKV